MSADEMLHRPFVLGVAGGTGSGKSTVADRMIATVGHQSVAVVALDSYYKHNTHLPIEERARMDYDHPESFDWDLLRVHVDMLIGGRAIDEPVYDFANHNRSAEVATVLPAPIIIIEEIGRASCRERVCLAV